MLPTTSQRRPNIDNDYICNEFDENNGASCYSEKDIVIYA